jgi:hypothetical protein
MSREAIAAAMPNLENFRASAQAGVSQVRINTPPSEERNFE